MLGRRFRRSVGFGHLANGLSDQVEVCAQRAAISLRQVRKLGDALELSGNGVVDNRDRCDRSWRQFPAAPKKRRDIG
jgi:hypothetical protein